MKKTTIIVSVAIVCIAVVITALVIFQNQFGVSKVKSMDDAITLASDFIGEDLRTSSKEFLVLSVLGNNVNCEVVPASSESVLTPDCDNAKTNVEFILQKYESVPENYYAIIGTFYNPLYVITTDGQIGNLTDYVIAEGM